MKDSKLSSSEIALLGVSVGGAISVAAAEGQFGLTDTAVGILLFLMLAPLLSTAKSGYSRVLISAASGMCLLLVFGFLFEILESRIYPETKHQLFHFIFWVVASILSFIFMNVFEKKE